MPRTDPHTASLSYELFGLKYAALNTEQLRTYSAEWRRRNRDKVLASRERNHQGRIDRYRQKYSDPVKLAEKREKEKQWRASHPQRLSHYYRKYRLKREFGITLERYDEMLSSQGGQCAICDRTASQLKPNRRDGAKLHVDHDHVTGKVRGLLCHHCNMVLGHLDDDIERMRAAIHYLEFYRGQHGTTSDFTGISKGVVALSK